MEAPKRARRPNIPTSRQAESITPRIEVQKPSTTRYDERCPTRYYPLYPLVARRRTPIRYC
jgi:hypothetical protein